MHRVGDTGKMSRVEFQHRMAAHCETGTISSILHHYGLDISEPMVLGIAGGIFFAYLDTPRLAFPTFVPRSKPGDIRKQIAKNLKIQFVTKKFRKPEKAKEYLNTHLSQNIPIVVQVDMFNMDYIPSYMRAHFNGHFITVVGNDDGRYQVSDCYYPEIASVKQSSLETGRFAKGDLAPGGFCFHPRGIPEKPDLRPAIIKGIKRASYNMTKLPIPFLGVKGIRMFSRKVLDWPTRARDREHLSHEIAMIHIILEERGTGGAGFRFMYASFLQEAAAILDNPSLLDMARKMTAIGDRWREISLYVARIAKARDFSADRMKQLSEMIAARADEEQSFFTRLPSMVA